MKNITFPTIPYAMDYVAQTKHLERMTARMNAAKGIFTTT
jgi:hypothetical protein